MLPFAANGAMHLHTMTIVLSTALDGASRWTGSVVVVAFTTVGFG